MQKLFPELRRIALLFKIALADKSQIFQKVYGIEMPKMFLQKKKI